MTKGRTPPPLPEFVFSSGRVVQIRKLSPETTARMQQAILKDMPDPPPPRQKVVTADGEVEAENPAHPEYQRALEALDTERQVEYARRFTKLLETYALIYEVDAEAVAAYRAAMAGIGTDLSDLNDAQVYLWHLCAEDQRDYQRLAEVVISHAQPAEAAVAAHTAMFPGDVPRAAA